MKVNCFNWFTVYIFSNEFIIKDVDCQRKYPKWKKNKKQYCCYQTPTLTGSQIILARIRKKSEGVDALSEPNLRDFRRIKGDERFEERIFDDKALK